MATVVSKLLIATEADLAFFGQKDAAQVAVLRRMVLDLRLPAKIVVCPIVREPDGLALSSRNTYLSAEERSQALALSRSIRHIESLVAAGERRAGVLIAKAREDVRLRTCDPRGLHRTGRLGHAAASGNGDVRHAVCRGCVGRGNAADRQRNHRVDSIIG